MLLGNLHLARDPPDAESAIQWYEEAATKTHDHPPHPDALFNLGQLYYNGVFAWAATTVAGCVVCNIGTVMLRRRSGCRGSPTRGRVFRAGC